MASAENSWGLLPGGDPVPDSDQTLLIKARQAQLLRLVTKGFYNELINYGIDRREVLTVAAHLLDHFLGKTGVADNGTEYYNRYFCLSDVQDLWQARQRLAIGQVVLAPLESALIVQVAAWLSTPATRDSFIPPFPNTETELLAYFKDSARTYFSIYYETQPVGIIGAEHVDPVSSKLEMRKLVGDTRLRGKGIGKRATFLFLYYAFKILNMNKVYIHSGDINIRNLNLNNCFGFELEGIFFEDCLLNHKRHDVVRMGLRQSHFLEIFSQTATAKSTENR